MPETTQSDLVERLEAMAEQDREYGYHARAEMLSNAAAGIKRYRESAERLQKIESQTDSGRFDEWPTATFVGQLRMQSRDSLDPEYSQFMAATANRMESLRAQCEAMAKAVETFTNGYLLDERDQPELCLDIEHHDAVVALFDALAAYRKEKADG